MAVKIMWWEEKLQKDVSCNISKTLISELHLEQLSVIKTGLKIPSSWGTQ